jgi:hypothetical protein
MSSLQAILPDGVTRYQLFISFAAPWF